MTNVHGSSPPKTTDDCCTYVEQRHIELQTGTIWVGVAESEYPLDSLCGLAARRNRKRGFLFVSRRLGRHIPVSVEDMGSVYQQLAGKLAQLSLPSGAVLFVGMAETAIALGHGVYQEFCQTGAENEATFVHTTRYHLNRPVCVSFLEEHSHAPSHILYEPEDDRNARCLHEAETLVLVDDEASTGKTFANLARELAKVMPRLKLVVTCVITDWRSPEHRQSTAAAMPCPVTSLSLLSGQYKFTPAETFPQGVDAPPATGGGASMDGILAKNYGRLGTRDEVCLPKSLLSRESLAAVAGKKVLVLATGEFAYPPFLLAKQLRLLGADVYCQATSRSPILLGGAIGSCLEFTDNYGDGMRNYLYNVMPGQYDRVFIASETPAAMVDPELVQMLDAQVVAF